MVIFDVSHLCRTGPVYLDNRKCEHTQTLRSRARSSHPLIRSRTAGTDPKQPSAEPCPFGDRGPSLSQLSRREVSTAICRA